MPKKAPQWKTVNDYLKQGKSLTHEEASHLLKVNRLAQRVAEIKINYEKAELPCPLMAVREKSDTHVPFHRYFFRGCGCALEHAPGAFTYGE